MLTVLIQTLKTLKVVNDDVVGEICMYDDQSSVCVLK